MCSVVDGIFHTQVLLDWLCCQALIDILSRLISTAKWKWNACLVVVFATFLCLFVSVLLMRWDLLPLCRFHGDLYTALIFDLQSIQV